MIIAILGAESTGKTSLADALVRRMRALTGLNCVFVPEWLRAWCDTAKRTPQPHEQEDIAAHQTRLLQQAASTCDIVVADTTSLMTAVYSDLLFGDPSLYSSAVSFHRNRCTVTLLTSLDIHWVADGLQRDGPHVREPVDSRIRAALTAGNISWLAITGTGEARVECALSGVVRTIELTDGRAIPREHPSVQMRTRAVR